MANRLHIAKHGCACQNEGGFHSRARLQFTNIERSKIFRVYIVGQLANKVRLEFRLIQNSDIFQPTSTAMTTNGKVKSTH